MSASATQGGHKTRGTAKMNDLKMAHKENWRLESDGLANDGEVVEVRENDWLENNGRTLSTTSVCALILSVGRQEGHIKNCCNYSQRLFFWGPGKAGPTQRNSTKVGQLDKLCVSLVNETKTETSGYATWLSAGGAIRIGYYDVIDDVITRKL